MGAFTFNTAPRHSLAADKCGTCLGDGFLKRGDFSSRTFEKCAACGGAGQRYKNPVPEPAATKAPKAHIRIG